MPDETKPAAAAAKTPKEVTIEIIANDKGKVSRHGGRVLVPGEKIKLREDKAQRHIDAGCAKLAS